MEDAKSSNHLNVLIVDDEANIRKTLALCLEKRGHQVVAVSNSSDARTEALRRPFDLAFVDLLLGSERGMDLIPQLLADSPWLKIVVVTAYAAIDTAVEAIKLGAMDYLPKPFTPMQVEVAANKASELRALEQKVSSLQQALGEASPEVDLESHSVEMQRVVTLARRTAQSEASILLRGESGTGKSVLARAIHSWSLRSEKPFSIVSCPSLSGELLESELFGHVRGAFTGAVRDNPGRIATSQGGTLFLDDIGDLPLAIQPKLLRFIQEREYERIGGQRTCRADVRIIAATNQDLETAIKQGRFREDLFYRLNAVSVEIPPLRRRPEDILALAERMLAFFCAQNHRRTQRFTDEARQVLQQYVWPGNLRELRNVIERAVILCQTEMVGIDCFPPLLAQTTTKQPVTPKLLSLEELEEEHIRRVLAQTRSLDEAATILGVDQATLWRHRKKYGI
jgi:NtrC-family two-component system response regulator AlgB